ncbi:MAG: hypothetical protein AAB600_05440, partial [Patescibacteria group bacterium]
MIRKTKDPRIEFSNLFNKQLKKAPSEVKIGFREALNLFLEDPNNPYLRKHPLKKKYAGFISIDIADDWRAIFMEKVEEAGNKRILFKFIGTHNQLWLGHKYPFVIPSECSESR